jgi:hypothetical protein
MGGFYRGGAEEEIRTPKPFQALPPQSSASTSFATSADWECKNNLFLRMCKFYFRNNILKVVPLFNSDDFTLRRPWW